MSWLVAVEEKIAALNVIADWAAITNQGSVRDNCRSAISGLRAEVERFKEQEQRVKEDTCVPLETITIEHDRNVEGHPNYAFTVRFGDRYADGLTFDEMLALVVALTAPPVFKQLAWLKTKKQWDAQAKTLDAIRTNTGHPEVK